MGLRSSVILENRDPQNGANLSEADTETNTSTAVLSNCDIRDTLHFCKESKTFWA